MPAIGNRTSRASIGAAPLILTLTVAVLVLLVSVLAVPVDATPSPSDLTAADEVGPTDEGSGQLTTTEIFQRRCNVDGASRVVPLHPSLGGPVPSLARTMGSLVRLDEPIPPGSYRASYLAYDGYPGRQWVTQPEEVFEVLFLADETPDGILGTIGPTADLADEVREAFQFSWPPGAATTITTTRAANLLAVRNAAWPDAPSPNSVQPVCLILFEETPPDDGITSCSAADLVARNEDATYGSTTGKLWSGSPTRNLFVLEQELAPGTYRLAAGSYDGYDGRAEATWEGAEQWVVEFRGGPDNRLLATSAPTRDLPDGPGHDEAVWEGSLGLVTINEEATDIVARHVGSGPAPNSVHVLCLGLSWQDEPSLLEVLARNDYLHLRASPVTTFPPGTYRLDLLAEFSSGHAGNAVGYLTADSDDCRIVIDGPIGGPGLTATGTGTLTVDRPFSLCLENPTATWSTDPDRNPDGLLAARIFEPDLSTEVSYLIGFEDFIDGDFQDLVVRLLLTDPAPLPAGLPPARPGLEVPWTEVGPDWLLTVVHGPVDGDDQPQGLYLVSPTGERWSLYAEVRSARVSSMSRILDWDLGEREALVLFSGPRDIYSIGVMDLRYGRGRPLTGLIGGIDPDASIYRSNAGGYLLLTLESGGTQRIVQLTTTGDVVTVHGPSLPTGARVDWIETPGPGDFVITDDVGVSDDGSTGRVTWVRPMFEREEVVATEDCVPVRWVRAGLAAVCRVADSPGEDLWIIPLEGAPMWPLVHAEISSLLDVFGFRDLHALDDDHLILESGVGDVWVLERGCGVPSPVDLPPVDGRLDVVGAVDGAVLAREVFGGRLLRLPVGGDEAQVLLTGVVATARWDAHVAIGDDAFPTPPLSPQARPSDTCDKRGPGDLAFLRDVRWGLHDGFTRVVFEFEADAPSTPRWVTRYVDGPIGREDPTRPDLVGDGLLEVDLRPSSRADLSGTEPRVVYDGPTEIKVGVGGLEAVRLLLDLENVMGWVVEIDGRRPYSAFALADPPRLVIDITDG